MNVPGSHSFSFTQFLAETPLDEQDKIARRNFLAYCYGTNKTFGEYYVALICDYLGLEWSRTADDVHQLSIYLRAYTIVDDDLRDVPQQNQNVCLETLRRHFLDNAWNKVEELSSHHVDSTQSFRTELNNYGFASDFYAKLHSNVNAPTQGRAYIERYADRMALVRVPFILLGAKSNQDRLMNGLRAIGHLMEALQILDDLVDWEEDFEQRRATFPITCYLSELTAVQSAPIESWIRYGEMNFARAYLELRGGLPFHPVMQTQIELVKDLLELAMHYLAKGLGENLLLYVQGLHRRIMWVLSRRTLKAQQADLIGKLKSSGAAPTRFATERII